MFVLPNWESQTSKRRVHLPSLLWVLVDLKCFSLGKVQMGIGKTQTSHPIIGASFSNKKNRQFTVVNWHERYENITKKHRKYPPGTVKSIFKLGKKTWPFCGHFYRFPPVDGSEIRHHLGCIKPCKSWDKLPTSTGDRRISEPSTVSFRHFTANFSKVTSPPWKNLCVWSWKNLESLFQRRETNWPQWSRMKKQDSHFLGAVLVHQKSAHNLETFFVSQQMAPRYFDFNSNLPR